MCIVGPLFYILEFCFPSTNSASLLVLFSRNGFCSFVYICKHYLCMLCLVEYFMVAANRVFFEGRSLISTKETLPELVVNAKNVDTRRTQLK